jgi:hypothetical protein
MGDLLLYILFIIIIPLTFSFLMGPTSQKDDDYMSSKDGNDHY